MSETSQTPSAEVITASSPACGERRLNRRRRVSLPLYVRPSGLEEDNTFEDVRSTQNASHDGLYFTTWCRSYRTGMRVLITFPYSPLPALLNVDYIGQVVRVEHLTDGRLGIAVRLLNIIRATSQESYRLRAASG
jgi:hypothetical protein